MAEYAALPPHVKIQIHRGCLFKARNSFHRCSTLSATQRKFSHELPKPFCFSARDHNGINVSTSRTKTTFKKVSTKCYCLVNVVNVDAASAFEWIPFADQGLLVASVFLTYMAGVIPNEKTHINPQKNILEKNVEVEIPIASGSSARSSDQFNLKHACDVVRTKLMESLNAIEHVNHLGEKLTEQSCMKRPLSLFAIAEGPRLRLLSSCLQQLQKEVENISEELENVGTSNWSTVFSNIIKQSFQLVSTGWLEKELVVGSTTTDKALGNLILEKLKQDGSITQNIRNSGKENLYSEFLCFLRFGSLREGSFYDCSLFSAHGISILEDLVITLADGVANIYLELISVDNSFSNEMSNVGVVLCALSTRSLQRLRNEVTLNQWLHQNMEAVIWMYEDRFDLSTLQKRSVDPQSKSKAEKSRWFKVFLSRKYELASPALSYAVISQLSMPVKRTKELRALTGWRYYFSLFLELSDISMPLIRIMFTKISDAVSFFLVCLIGQSLGLIYTGIRQSLLWK